MAYIRCDVASSGPYRFQHIGEMFPRVDVSPVGGWVAMDCNPDGSVFVMTSVGVRMELGPRQPNNPACPRFQTDGHFHCYMVAWDGAAIFGRHLIFDQHGYYVREEPHFEATAGTAMGILDISVDGVVLWWNGNSAREVDGLTLLNWRERGDYIVGQLAHTWLGNSVFVKSTKQWYRAWPYDTQLFPGIAEDGTVSSQGEGGGFTGREDWLTRPFDPHDVIEPVVSPLITKEPQSVTVEQGDFTTLAVEATGTAPLHYEWHASDTVDVVGDDRSTYTTPELEATTHFWVEVWNGAGRVTSTLATVTVTVPIDPIDTVEPKMTRCTVLVDNVWHEVEEVPHPDAGPDHGPVVGVVRIKDGLILKIRHDGKVEFEAGSPGADERCIPVPGGYVALRDVTVVVDKAGPWAK